MCRAVFLLLLLLSAWLVGCRQSTTVQQIAPSVSSSDELFGSWGVDTVVDDGQELLMERGAMRWDIDVSQWVVHVDGKSNGSKIQWDWSTDPPSFVDREVGQHGILRAKDNRLTICLTAFSHPKPQSFESRAGSKVMLVNLRRMAPQKIGLPVSQREAEQFTAALMQAVNAGQADTVDSLIDLAGMIDRIIREYPLTTSERLSYLHGWRRTTKVSIGGPQSIGQRLTKIVTDGGNVKVIRMQNSGTTWQIVMRQIEKTGNGAYQELSLGRDTLGNVVASDINVVGSPAPTTENMRRAMIPSLVNVNAAVRNTLPKEYDELIQCGDALNNYGRLIQQQQFEEAEEVYQSLPPLVRENFFLVSARLNSSDIQVLKPRLEEAQTAFPNETSFKLMSIALGIQNGDRDLVLKAIASMEKLVGEDAYLDLLRSFAHAAVGDEDQAQQFRNAALLAEPELLRFVDSTTP